MTTFLAALVVFAVALGGMAIGVMLTGRRIKGSCGGLSNFKDSSGNPVCEGCSTPAPDCSRRRAEETASQPS